MSGIAGLVGFRGEPNLLHDVLLSLVKPLNWKENEKAWVQYDSTCAVGVIGKPRADNPALIYDEWTLLAYYGRIVRDDCFEEAVSAAGYTPNLPLAETLLGLYHECGMSALQGFNGQYVIVVWDARRHSLSITTDRRGLQPFYYWQNGDQLVFASSVKAIAQHPEFHRQVSPHALYDLLATGQMLGERTLFEDVHALPPAAALTFSGGQFMLRRYWQPALYQHSDLTVPVKQAVEQMEHEIKDAVRRHTDADGCLLLTGGVDSRWLAGSLANLNGREAIQANTIGHPRARDAKLASRIAAELHLKHTIIPVNPQYITDYSRELVRRTEGNMNCSAGWILGEIPYLQKSGVGRVITGVGAEMISGRHWLAEQTETDICRALQRISAEHWQFQPAAALMREEYRAAAPQSSLDLLEECLREAPSDDPISRYDYLHLMQHRRHPTGNVLSGDVEVIEPFFDNDLIDYAFSLPTQLRAHIYKSALVKSFPELAAIEATEHGVSIKDEVNKKVNPMHRVKRLLFRASRKLALPLGNDGPVGDAPWNTIYPNHWIRTSSRDFIQLVFNKLYLLEQWIDVPAAMRLLSSHMNGRSHAYTQICALVTAILWIEYMME